jgi:hypothetical protein
MGVTYSLILPSNSIDHSTLQQSFVGELDGKRGDTPTLAKNDGIRSKAGCCLTMVSM